MNPDFTALRIYIEEQRRSGLNDEAIYQSLLSSGWQAEAIAPLFATSSQAISPNMPSPIQSGVTSPTLNQEATTGLLKGRLNRMGFLLSFLSIIGYFVLIIILQISLPSTAEGLKRLVTIIALLMGMLGVAATIPISISIHVRRWHDMGQSGWMALLAFVPVVNFFTGIALFFIPGTPGPNKFGPPPSTAFSFKTLIGLK